MTMYSVWPCGLECIFCMTRPVALRPRPYRILMLFTTCWSCFCIIYSIIMQQMLVWQKASWSPFQEGVWLVVISTCGFQKVERSTPRSQTVGVCVVLCCVQSVVAFAFCTFNQMLHSVLHVQHLSTFSSCPVYRCR